MMALVHDLAEAQGETDYNARISSSYTNPSTKSEISLQEKAYQKPRNTGLKAWSDLSSS